MDLKSLLSHADYDCFDFHDLQSLSQNQRDSVANTSLEILHWFLDALPHHNSVAPSNEALRKGVLEWAEKNVVPKVTKPDHCRAVFRMAALASERLYPLGSDQTRLKMSIFTGMLAYIDDEVTTDSPSSQQNTESMSFFNNTLTHVPQDSSWWPLFEQVIEDLAAYLGSKDPLIGNWVLNSIHAGVNATALEHRVSHDTPVHFQDPSHGGFLPSSATEAFPPYMRSMVVNPLVYTVPAFIVSPEVQVPLSYWVSVAPQIGRYVAFINDLLSFPKEIRAGEEWSYLSMTTRARRQAGKPSRFSRKGAAGGDSLWTFRDTLHEAIEEALKVTAGVDQAFARFDKPGEKDRHKIDEHGKLAHDVWKAFRHGYVAFHLNSARYGLSSLRDRGELAKQADKTESAGVMSGVGLSLFLPVGFLSWGLWHRVMEMGV